MTQTTWATNADVLALTHVTVSDTEMANAVVELHAGRTYAAVATTGAKDTEWMRRAVAYQAVWMDSQPDVFTRLDFEAIGGQRTPTPITATAMTLAPLARMALSRVSWLKSRSLHVRAPFVDGLGPLNSDPTSSENDPYELWSPMGGS